jgi:TfoX/Sxy family transcriptional regulator of competence genes
MAYDEKLAERIRELVASEPGITEAKMFGGLAFLVGGNMAVGASGQGGILVRVDPAESDSLTAGSAAAVAEMRGRPMPGWVRVASADLLSEAQLRPWVERGVAYAHSLPARR